ncbi:hypothetical protein [Aeromonas cavernicola]|uniref:DUF4864 domain-containing protein n=1 Tax=Aeromonas cavernicola TaxID=1006623 RepID=A0A2H9U6F5_9GAMM|nr:hypothetical protein [Aeromonas cavernicola]PJG59637.1 hypothetical protein CUC53_06210 [Aeromonas cavernicola]
MQKIGFIAMLLLANMVNAQPQIVFGRLASAPVQQFNQQIRQAGSQQQAWVNDYREVALRFVGHRGIPNRIHAQQLDNDLVLSVALNGKGNDTLYILTLFRNNNIWQMRQAEIGWRCQGEDAFTPVPCA